MSNWKADLDALVEETMAFTKSITIQPPMPRAVIEPNRILLMNLNKSERDEIQQRVASFRTHQARFAREREDFAASLLKRILGNRYSASTAALERIHGRTPRP